MIPDSAEGEPDAFAPVSLGVADFGCDRGGRAVFRGVSFELQPGQVLDVRGPNGVGKSTLLRALAGLTGAVHGELRWRTQDREAARPRADAMSYQGHKDPIKGVFTARENLTVWAKLARGRSRVDSALETVGLARLADAPGRLLSAGQRRRLSFARLLAERRPVWLLDEPNAGLDAQGAELVGALLDDHLARGGLAVLASHARLPAKTPFQTLVLEPG